ncbi:hypothetical protein HQ576_03510 [bacterium]|nr:hypothetical protein [bacterium]
MRRRLVILGVVGIWLVMTGTLLARYIRERRLASLPGTYRSILTRGRRNYQERLGIYWRGQRVGHTQTLFYFRDDGKHDIQNKTEVVVAIPGFPRATAFKLDMSVLVGQTLALESLRLRLESEVFTAECNGVTRKGKLTLYPRINDQRQEPIELDLPPGGVISQGLSPLLALPPLKEGMHWSTTVVDPFTLSPTQVTMRVVAREDLEWEGRTVRTHVVDIQSGLWMGARAWVSGDGEVLKQKTVLGLTFIKEPVPEHGSEGSERNKEAG